MTYFLLSARESSPIQIPPVMFKLILILLAGILDIPVIRTLSLTPQCVWLRMTKLKGACLRPCIYIMTPMGPTPDTCFFQRGQTRRETQNNLVGYWNICNIADVRHVSVV